MEITQLFLKADFTPWIRKAADGSGVKYIPIEDKITRI